MDYKDKLKLAKEALDSGSYDKETIEYIFPELAESEDEKIRKELIEFVKSRGGFKQEYIAWLEKQGEQSSLNINRECLKGIKRVQEYQDLSDWEKEFDKIASMYAHNKNQEGYNDSWYVKERAAEMLYYAKKELEKQGEQKPTLPKWKYKKDNTTLLKDSLVLNKCGHMAKLSSGAIVSDVWVLDYDELAKLPKEELEKQGEQKPTLRERYKNIAKSEWFKKTHEGMSVSDDEKVDNVNKIEPKFKVGDFIVSDYCMGKVIALTDDAYLLDTEQGIPFSCEHNAHLWTIQDAKDGDVLAERLSSGRTIIIIYNGLNEEDTILSHCGYNGSDFVVPKNGIGFGHLEFNLYTLATKEQRDLLFQKMKEAGYEWDAEKKELIKIEQKPAWSEEDSARLQRIIDFLWYNRKGDTDTIYQQEQDIDWLKSLKKRIGG